MTSSRDVMIRRNHFEDANSVLENNTGAQYGIDHNAVVWLESCEVVVLDGNVITARDTFDGMPLHAGMNVEGLVDNGNGIKVVPAK